MKCRIVGLWNLDYGLYSFRARDCGLWRTINTPRSRVGGFQWYYVFTRFFFSGTQLWTAMDMIDCVLVNLWDAGTRIMLVFMTMDRSNTARTCKSNTFFRSWSSCLRKRSAHQCSWQMACLCRQVLSDAGQTEQGSQKVANHEIKAVKYSMKDKFSTLVALN